MHKDPGVAMLPVIARRPAVSGGLPGAPHSWLQCSEGPLPVPEVQLLACLSEGFTFWDCRWRVGNALG